MLNVLNEDFVRTARSKGLREKIVIYKHSLMNALVPIVSVLGIYFIINLGSSIMTEIVFSRPGLGKVIVMAMKQRDYVMLQSVMVVYSTLAILINLLVDLIYGFIDPRIKYK
jgi:ABC-type dipeptide/oligopeptide/nickel transport system permease component